MNIWKFCKSGSSSSFTWIFAGAAPGIQLPCPASTTWKEPGSQVFSGSVKKHSFSYFRAILHSEYFLNCPEPQLPCAAHHHPFLKDSYMNIGPQVLRIQGDRQMHKIFICLFSSTHHYFQAPNSTFALFTLERNVYDLKDWIQKIRGEKGKKKFWSKKYQDDGNPSPPSPRHFLVVLSHVFTW